MSDKLTEAFEYFLAHKDELLEKYNGQFVVIADDRVLAAYRSEAEAVNETRKTRELGTFLVQQVSPGTDAYTRVFHSRAAFA